MNNSSELEKLLRSGNYYCHMTRIGNIPSILANGLKANKHGEIFVYDDVTVQTPYKAGGERFYVGDAIALDQVFVFDDEYAVFFIDKKDIVGKVVADNVGELTSPWQHIIKQDRITPLSFVIIKNRLKEVYKKLYHTN